MTVITATITKHFHRNEGVMCLGDVVQETMRFASFEDMDRFGTDINRNHANVPYAITSAVVDQKNFICFDMEEITTTYGDIPWNELGKSHSFQLDDSQPIYQKNESHTHPTLNMIDSASLFIIDDPDGA